MESEGRQIQLETSLKNKKRRTINHCNYLQSLGNFQEENTLGIFWGKLVFCVYVVCLL